MVKVSLLARTNGNLLLKVALIGASVLAELRDSRVSMLKVKAAR